MSPTRFAPLFVIVIGAIAATNGTYRESALFLAHLLDLHGPLSPKDLRNLGAKATKTTPVLSANHYGWFVKNPDGTYDLTDGGREALVLYSPMILAFRTVESDV